MKCIDLCFFTSYNKFKMNKNDLTQFSIKYRPIYFKDVFGQQDIVKALLQRSKTNNFPQVTLLQGKYGTGKSTLAYILAAAMNKHDENGEPIWDCPDNKSILNQTFDRDTQLLDGSSMSTKDEMIGFTSSIKTRAMYSESGLRIFIVEEADQISQAAALSLLKILESPNPNNKFILLSMENKVPPAIKSRCQVFNLKPLSVKDTMYALKNILEKEGKWNDPNIPNEFRLQGLSDIAISSQGSLRTALQNLESCLEAEAYTSEQINELLGTVDELSTFKILQGLLEKSNDEIMWGTIYKADPQELYNYMTLLLSNAMIYKTTGYIDNETFRNSTAAIANNPNVDNLFDTLTLSPQLNKPYMRKADLLSALAQYYRIIKIGNAEKGQKLIEGLTPKNEKGVKIRQRKMDITF